MQPFIILHFIDIVIHQNLSINFANVASKKTLQIYVKTTETCNLNCSHCFTSGSKGKKIFFNPAASFHYICKLVDNQGLKSLNIVFHGGEPLMAPAKDIKKMVDLVKISPYKCHTGSTDQPCLSFN